MAKIVFKSYNPNDNLLLPPCLGDYLPQNHPARVISAIVDRLDISEIVSGYAGGGTSSYNPRMLLKIIVYAYLNNVYSGRQMEKLLVENIAYMWLSGMQTPDFRTINIFRSKRLANKFDDIFTQIVLLLHDEGLVSLKVQYIDGTKIESVANKYTFVWKGSTEKNKAKLENNVREVLKAAETALAMENAEEKKELSSAEMAKRADRILKKMDEDGISDKKMRKTVEKVKSESAPKMKEYEDKLDILGDRNSYSKTDPDATFMRMKEDAMNNGQTKPGYNVQISTENQYIVNMQMYWNPTDTTTLPDFLLHGRELTGVMPKDCTADSGYGSEENYEFMLQNDIAAYVKYNWFHKEQHRPFRDDPFRQENLYYNKEKDYYVCPMGQHMTLVGVTRKVSDTGFVSYSHKYRAQRCTGCPLRPQCYKSKAEQRTIEVNHNLNEHKRKVREMLTSEEGLRHRSRRPIEPEAVFGQIKFDWHYRRFRHKGKDKVYMDFAILAMAHNLRKLMRKAQNELMEGSVSNLSRLYKPNRPHIMLVRANNRNFRIAA